MLTTTIPQALQLGQSSRPPPSRVAGRRVGARKHPRQLHLAGVHADGPVSCLPPFHPLAAAPAGSFYTFPRDLAADSLCPATRRTQKILDDNPDLRKQWVSLIPQGKMGQPEDLMGPLTFLLSDAAGYVTGADLRVDGGYTVT